MNETYCARKTRKYRGLLWKVNHGPHCQQSSRFRESVPSLEDPRVDIFKIHENCLHPFLDLSKAARNRILALQVTCLVKLSLFFSNPPYIFPMEKIKDHFRILLPTFLHPLLIEWIWNKLFSFITHC